MCNRLEFGAFLSWFVPLSDPQIEAAKTLGVATVAGEV
jgi:hypothetical protein